MCIRTGLLRGRKPSFPVLFKLFSAALHWKILAVGQVFVNRFKETRNSRHFDILSGKIVLHPATYLDRSARWTGSGADTGPGTSTSAGNFLRILAMIVAITLSISKYVCFLGEIFG